MARKEIFVSDFSGKEIDGEAATLTIRSPKWQGTATMDLTPEEADQLIEGAVTEVTIKKRRGRPPKKSLSRALAAS